MLVRQVNSAYPTPDAAGLSLVYMQDVVKLEASGAFYKYSRLLVHAPRLKNS
jgi:hypothetical protein